MILSWDIEIADKIDDISRLGHPETLSMCCSAIEYVAKDTRKMTTWPSLGGPYTERLSQERADAIVAAMAVAVVNGAFILTWNGLGFDFPVLAANCSPKHRNHVETMAVYAHIDLGFAMACSKGFMCGLEAAGMGLGVGQKAEGIHGDQVPELWANGEYEKVLRYVQGDARLTTDVFLAAKKEQCIRWITKKGKVSTWSLPEKLTVVESLKTPAPDTSWMSDPRPRSSYYNWIKSVTIVDAAL